MALIVVTVGRKCGGVAVEIASGWLKAIGVVAHSFRVLLVVASRLPRGHPCLLISAVNPYGANPERRPNFDVLRNADLLIAT